MSPPIYARAAKAILGSSLLDAPAERVVGVQRAPGVLNFILRPSLQHFFNNARVIRAALGAGDVEGAEGQFLTVGAFEHSSLWAPSVDFAHLHVLNLVVGVDAFDHLRHLSLLSTFQEGWPPQLLVRATKVADEHTPATDINYLSFSKAYALYAIFRMPKIIHLHYIQPSLYRSQS